LISWPNVYVWAALMLCTVLILLAVRLPGLVQVRHLQAPGASGLPLLAAIIPLRSASSACWLPGQNEYRKVPMPVEFLRMTGRRGTKFAIRSVNGVEMCGRRKADLEQFNWGHESRA